MKVLVCGGRDYSDRNHVYDILDEIHKATPIELLINGGAKGADRLASSWADNKLIATRTFLANWSKFGLAAGPLRNKEMLKEGKPDLIIAFPGNSGTADMLERARKAGIEVREIPARESTV